ncbi:uncharacterized protein LOC141665870 [Apium graveolens]|uniref:uncharacterized protein LOC141665870 n=1 Tax=Apium graveolens TaxID=4045 RepID=UPI003D7AD74A
MPDSSVLKKQSCLNEVNQYLDGRYVCASEAAWKIFGFDVHSRWPSVDRLPIHLPGNKYVSFRTCTTLSEVVQQANSKRTKLEAWFEANKEFPAARDFTYAEFPTHFTWLPRECKWRPRQRGNVVGILTEVHATGDDLLYLRMLLIQRKGCTSFDELMTVEGHFVESFKEACAAMGLLQNGSQWHEAMVENSHSSFAKQLREMFVNILAYCSISDPLFLWNAQWKCMSDDIILLKRKECRNGNLQLPDYDIQNFALAEIEKLLNDIGKSLKDFPTMPYPPEVFRDNSGNGLIAEETGYNTEQMKRQHDENYIKLNREQKEVYEAVVESVNSNKGEQFFGYGSGGYGKTFVWQTLLRRLHSECKIVLPVSSSGIVAVLLDGGRTAHSRFHIPIIVDQCSIVGIKHGTDLAELLQNTSLIIWDEAPMQHRHGIESVDKCLRDIMAPIDPSRSSRPFGGITVVFGGDYRQTLPLAIGDGKVHNITENPGDDGLVDFEIPEQFIVHGTDNPIQSLFDITYPDFLSNMSSYDYLRSRAILTPTNSLVDDINDFVIEKIPGKTHTYFSQDSIYGNGGEDNDFDTAFPVEYLNSINMSCLPKHQLQIKNVQLHSFIPLELLSVFSQTFAEGNIYEIVHFRCVRGLKIASENSSPTKIYFSQSTIVKHVIGDDWSVSLQKYHFVSLQNFTNNVGNNYSHDGLDDSPLAASDIIGVVYQEIHSTTVQTVYGETKCLNFYVSDGMSKVEVKFLGDLAKEANELFYHDIQQSIVVILSLFRQEIISGRAFITNLPFSVIYVNPDILKVEIVRNRYLQF